MFINYQNLNYKYKEHATLQDSFLKTDHYVAIVFNVRGISVPEQIISYSMLCDTGTLRT